VEVPPLVKIRGLIAVNDRPQRADAKRNREKLLIAATDTFAENGPDVALETIAARAGVGVGTLYRHFPNRETLMVATYQHEVDALCAAAEELLGSQPADEALRAWIERFATYAAAKRGMGEALLSALASDSAMYAETREQILDALRLLLDAGAESGTLRADIAPEDVMRVISAIWYVPSGPQWGEIIRNMLTLVIDGLRYGTQEQTS
jgi:AcrR family transcriptional regulator